MFNLGHSIRTASSHADGLQPIENTSQQDYQLPTLIAAAQQDPGTGTPSADAGDTMSEECLAFRRNIDADLGKLPVRFGRDVYYSVIQPDDIVGTKWSLLVYMRLAAPSALFKWML